MGQPFLAEVRIFSFNFPPKGWAFCNGQTLSIQQNQALFSLLGTTYGGNGVTTFQLPNLQGRVPAYVGNGLVQGEIGGQVNHTLIITEIPAHVHTLQGSNAAATVGNPTSATLAQPVAQVGNVYGAASAPTTMAPQSIANTGGSQPHSNLQPYLVLSFCIALQGIFPSRN